MIDLSEECYEEKDIPYQKTDFKPMLMMSAPFPYHLYISLMPQNVFQVLFFGTPALEVSSTILTLASLIPGMLELGLCDCASYSLKKPSVRVAKELYGDEGYLEVHYRRSSSEDLCDTMTSSVMSNGSHTSPNVFSA